jgi:hypothetical protein
MSDLSGVLDLSGVSNYLFNPQPPKPYIVSLEELLASHTVVTQKETADRSTVMNFLNPLEDDLRPKLFEWAAAGFPTIYTIQSLSLTPPVTCSDGASRNVLQYSEFLTSTTITQSVSTLQGKMPGLEVTISHSANTITLHVSRGS